MSNFKKAWQEVKKGAPSEFGLFVFMTIFGLCAAVIMLPVIWLMSKLPDWTWWIWGAAMVIWLLFGDTIGRAWAAFRGTEK